MRVLGAVLCWARVCCFSSAHQVWTIAPQDGSIGVLRRGQSGDGLGSARGSALQGGCGCHWQALKEASHYACIYFICTINRELELFGVKYSPSLPLNKISASLCPMPIKGDVFVLLDVITYHPSFLKLNPMLFSFYFLLFFPLWFLCCCCFISNFGLSLSLFTEISSSLYLEKVKHQIKCFLEEKMPKYTRLRNQNAEWFPAAVLQNVFVSDSYYPATVTWEKTFLVILGILLHSAV